MTQGTNLQRTQLTIAITAMLCGAAGGVAAQTQATGVELDRLADVVVTAQKVAQPSSKTAISITAVTGEDLRTAGAATAVNLTTLMPNIQISGGQQGSTDISIRGIVSTNTSEIGDPAAAFHIDGVYLARSQAAGATFYDLERVEVLRGPQGTLYGRNATAGAINLITNKPTNKFAAEANLGLGNYNSKHFEGMLNAPINDQLAVRAVVSSSVRDGYLITAGAPNNFSMNRDDADNRSARIHGLLKISADTRLLMTADSSADKGAGPGSIPIATFLNNTGDAQRTALGNKNEGSRDVRTNGLAAEFVSNLGIGELTYLGARRTLDRNDLSSTGVITSSTISSFSQTSHELRLASNTKSALTWVGGLYSFDESGNVDYLVGGYNPAGAANPGYRFIQGPVRSNSKALFGQATYSLTPALRLTAGVRDTKDEKSRIGQTTTAAASPVFGTSNDLVNYSQSSWKLGADYDLNPNVMTYASVATGYKAGGFFDGSGYPGVNNYRPELLTSLEAGVKGRFLNKRLRLNATIFSYDYKDLQITYVNISPATGRAGTVTMNAARATNTGLELEGKWAVSNNGTVNFALGLLDAKYDSFVFPVVTGRPEAIDYAGKSLDRAPKSTLVLGYTHDWNLSNGAGLTAYIGARYSASYVLTNFAVAIPVQYTQDAFTYADINATYTAANDKWSVQGFVKNLGNRTAMTGFSYSSLTGSQVYLNEPRTFGLRATVRF